MKLSMPQVRWALEAVSWPSETRRYFIPMGSEQPVVFERTVNGKRRGAGERERDGRGEEQRIEEGQEYRERKTPNDCNPKKKKIQIEKQESKIYSVFNETREDSLFDIFSYQLKFTLRALSCIRRN